MSEVAPSPPILTFIQLLFGHQKEGEGWGGSTWGLREGHPHHEAESWLQEFRQEVWDEVCGSMEFKATGITELPADRAQPKD